MRNGKALTARGALWKFLHGLKQILPEPGPSWPGCGYATAMNSTCRSQITYVDSETRVEGYQTHILIINSFGPILMQTYLCNNYGNFRFHPHHRCSTNGVIKVAQLVGPNQGNARAIHIMFLIT